MSNENISSKPIHVEDVGDAEKGEGFESKIVGDSKAESPEDEKEEAERKLQEKERRVEDDEEKLREVRENLGLAPDGEEPVLEARREEIKEMREKMDGDGAQKEVTDPAAEKAEDEKDEKKEEKIEGADDELVAEYSRSFKKIADALGEVESTARRIGIRGMRYNQDGLKTLTKNNEINFRGADEEFQQLRGFLKKDFVPAEDRANFKPADFDKMIVAFNGLNDAVTGLRSRTREARSSNKEMARKHEDVDSSCATLASGIKGQIDYFDRLKVALRRYQGGR